MPDSLTIDVDTTALLGAFAAAPDAVQARLKLASKRTADAIADEARGRVRRRTGATAAAITVEETHAGDGYVIFVGDRTRIGRYLEYGTQFMSATPFLFASARIEAGAHDRRAREAVQDGIDETGLGE